MPLSNYANGTGNIRTYTTNTTVIGYGTTFLTQLQLGAVIGNVSNTFVGYVSNINSNTSITLTANANVAISSNTNPTNFHFRAMTANVPTYAYGTTGNITANVNSTVVTGNSTHFATELTYGDMLYVANGSYPNVYLGRVEYIISNTSLYLNANSLANVSNLQYFNEKTTTTFFGVGPGLAYDEPNTVVGLYTVNSQLYRWAKSGLIPNVAVVNNYHPPIRDSVTGILVNLPATIYQKTGNSYTNIYTLGSSLAYTGNGSIVKDFDVNQKVFATDVSYVKNALYNGDALKTAAKGDDTQFFNSTISQAIPQTMVDYAASLIGANVARVTDNHDLAKQYFNQDTPLDSIKTYPQNLTSNQDLNLRKEAKGLRKLVPTGAPIAIPGLLNAVADVYVPNNVSWTPPTFSRTNVK
jgi:hypothetical protein